MTGRGRKASPLFCFWGDGLNNRLIAYFAKEQGVHAERLRSEPGLKWEALGKLCRFPNKEAYSLKEWEEAVSFLLGCEIHFASYEEIGKSLKPFSLKLR